MNKNQILKSINYFTKKKLFKLISFNPSLHPYNYIGALSTKNFNIIYCKNIVFGCYLSHLNVLEGDIISGFKLPKYKKYLVLFDDNFIFEGKYHGRVNLPQKYSTYAFEKKPFVGSGVYSCNGLIFSQGEEYIVIAPHLIKCFEILKENKE